MPVFGGLCIIPFSSLDIIIFGSGVSLVVSRLRGGGWSARFVIWPLVFAGRTVAGADLVSSSLVCFTCMWLSWQDWAPFVVLCPPLVDVAV
jgi:hypothetical protein